MNNLKVLIYVESRYKVDRKRIKASIANVLAQQGISAPVEVSIAIIGDRKMRRLNIKYRDLDKVSNVLSFPLNEGERTPFPLGITRLGDVVISYPEIIREAAKEDVLVDDKIDQLIRHGLLHLLGIHH